MDQSHTHTHTLLYIYIYIFLLFCSFTLCPPFIPLLSLSSLLHCPSLSLLFVLRVSTSHFSPIRLFFLSFPCSIFLLFYSLLILYFYFFFLLFCFSFVLSYISPSHWTFFAFLFSYLFSSFLFLPFSVFCHSSPSHLSSPFFFSVFSSFTVNL